MGLGHAGSPKAKTMTTLGDRRKSNSPTEEDKDTELAKSASGRKKRDEKAVAATAETERERS